MLMSLSAVVSAVLLLSSCTHSTPGSRRPTSKSLSSASIGWGSYAGDAHSSKFISSTRINRTNVARLKLAWTTPSADNRIEHPLKKLISINQATPIMVNGALYTSTSLNQIMKLDPASGEVLWTFDSQTLARNPTPPNSGFVNRGVSHWQSGDDERIFMGTADYYLVAVDAKTGAPVSTFGNAGVVDLLPTLAKTSERTLIGVSSPPAICGDVVIVGSSIADYALKKKNHPSGDVQAFDAKTGAHLWSFKTIPTGREFGARTWKKKSAAAASGANVWAPMTVDTELGRVFLPTSTPTDDLYGGNRPGDGLFAESLVSLDCKTGKRDWHFQLVHHGIWDYDLPAPPVLMDIRKGGKTIKAVAQVTKQGFTFVFNRVSGKPLWPIRERQVPRSRVEGEAASRTQPMPTLPAPFDRQGLNREDVIDFTPELKATTLEYLSQFNSGPLYTPPSLEKPTVVIPGGYGGASWAGAAYSPTTQMLYVPSVTLPFTWGLKKDPDSEFGITVDLATTKQLRRPDGLPILKPPYGRITAIDMVSGKHVWMTPIGRGPRDHEALRGAALPPGDLGWDRRTFVLTTPELLFAAQAGPFAISGAQPTRDGGVNSFMIKTSIDDPKLRALDPLTGVELASVTLPGNATGAIMSYEFDGKQYVVIPYGGANLPAGFVAVTVED